MALETGGRMAWRGDPLSRGDLLFSGVSKHGLSVALLPDAAVRRNDCTPSNAGRSSSAYVSHCRKVTLDRVILLTQNETASAKAKGLRELGLWLLP